MVPIDDEAGDDIESEKEEEAVVELVPVPVSASKGLLDLQQLQSKLQYLLKVLFPILIDYLKDQQQQKMQP